MIADFITAARLVIETMTPPQLILSRGFAVAPRPGL